MIENKKKALVLAAGVPQAVLAEKLRQRGYYIIMADYTKEPVGVYAADKFYCESTLDIDAIRKIAVDEKVDLIMTVCTDQAMLTVSLISEELGLPCYVSYETGLKMTNKKHMKEMFASNGVPSAKHVIVDSFDLSVISEKTQEFDFPMVVKPVDCNSSKGVIKVYDISELSEAVEQAIRFSRTSTAVIEEFKSGIELSCDLFVTDGKAELLTVSNSEKIKSDNKFVIYRSIYPVPGVTCGLKKKITEIGQKIADAYNLTNCPMLIQMLYDGSELNVIEFSARTGGCIKYKLIENTSSVDIIDKTIDVTLNGVADVKPVESMKMVRNEFVYCYDGVFDHLEGFEELKNEGIIENYYLLHTKGCVFDGVNSSGDRICAYTIIADDKKEMIEKHNTAISRMKVVSDKGDDMFRRDILVKEEYSSEN